MSYLARRTQSRNKGGFPQHVPFNEASYGKCDTGRDRLRPISTSASFFFSSSANSTSANFDFGQFRLRPIFGCLGPSKGGAPKGGAPKGGAQKGGAQKGGAQKGGAQKGGAQKGGRPKISRFFFPPPPQFSFFFLSLGVLAWNFGGV